MRLYDVNGRLTSKTLTKYLIKWDAPCRSIIQFKVKQFLKPYWKNMIVYEEAPCFGSQLKVDILNLTLKIAVEVQGKQHHSFNKFFHNNNTAVWLKSIKNDDKKLRWLEKNEIQLWEIMEEEVPKLDKQFFVDKFGVTL